MALRRPEQDTPPVDPDETEPTEFQLPPIVELTLEESREFFDAKARQLLGMSGAEFVERLDTGEYDDVLDDGDHSDHLYLAMLSGHVAQRDEPKTKALPLSHRRAQKAPSRTQAVEASDFELPPVRTLTLEEGEAFFDAKARELLGISGPAFVERYYAGDYDDILDDPDHRDVLYLAMLGTVGRSK